VLNRISFLPTAKSDPELHPFRPALLFGLLNALAWQIAVGTPMILFAQQLGATPFQVGLAYSFVFILAPVQVISTALLPRYGFKAVMLGGWKTRTFFLFVPALLAVLAMRGEAPWMVPVFVGSIFFFCLFRSIGTAAHPAWFFAILPAQARGRFFASDQMAQAVGCVGTLIVSAALFTWLPVYAALLGQYLLALAASTLSYFALQRLPDAERPVAISLRTVLRDTPRFLFAPSTFRSYVWLVVIYAVISTPIPPFVVYYLKVGVKLTNQQIVLFEILRYLGVMVAAWLIRRRIDETGAKPFFIVACGLYLLVGLYWVFFLRTGVGGIAGVAAIYFVLGMAVATWTIANFNYLPKVIGDQDRALAISIHSAVNLTLGGLSPIVWGFFLKGGGDGARSIDPGMLLWVFITVAVGAVVLSVCLARLPEDKSHPVEPILFGNAILRPFRAATYLINLIDPRSLAPKRPPEGGRDSLGN